MTATFQGVGTLQFTPDNKHAFITSGEKSTPSSTAEVTLLEFETQSYYLIAKVLFSYSDSFDTDNLKHSILFDDVSIFEYSVTGASTYTEPDNYIPLIIPPFTNVKMNTQNLSGNARSVWNLITAEVKGPIEQFDLEVKNE